MTDKRSQLELGIMLTLYILACISLALRIYVRVKMLRVFGVDDWLMSFAMAFFTVYVVILLIGIHHQMDRHIQDIDPSNIPIALKIEFLSGLIYAITTPLLKASIGTLLLRFVRRKLYVYIIWLGITLSLAGSLWTFFELVLFCTPPSHFWDPTVSGTCKSSSVLSRAVLGQNTINFITDIVFGILPAFVVYELKMNRNTKVSLAVILLLGNCAMVATAVRFHFVISLPVASPDFLFLIVDARILSTVEIGLGAIMASLVTLRPLFRALLHLGSSNKSKTGSGNRRRQGYANQLSSAEHMSRVNDGDVPLYPVTTTKVVAGKTDNNGGSSRSSEWERTDDESESFESRMGRIQREVTYTIQHDKV